MELLIKEMVRCVLGIRLKVDRPYSNWRYLYLHKDLPLMFKLKFNRIAQQGIYTNYICNIIPYTPTSLQYEKIDILNILICSIMLSSNHGKKGIIPFIKLGKWALLEAKDRCWLCCKAHIILEIYQS